ncbi:methyltransferase, FxLD system [Streptomyces sp. NPDC087850]|uniref:methyltransferase, FxLD system n=1 Tax=Streptomyces sp. NPDC087850 TaxID=3365809 RepID=UPI003807EF0E
MGYTRTEWSEHYTGGRGFRGLGDEEKRLLAELAPAPEGGRALDVCCGTGGMAVHLASLGYTVDGVDFSDGALERARTEHAEVETVRWLCLDVEHDDPAGLAEDGYDLIVLRLAIAFIRDRARVLRGLSARLRKDGVLVVITPVVEHTPQEQRHIALDENELAALADGFEHVKRFDAEGLALLALRGPAALFSAQEKLRPEPQAVFGVAIVVTNASGRVLLGRSTKNMWELPGGRIEPAESAPAAAVRELGEETGLVARVEDAHAITVLHDDHLGVRRITAVVRITRWDGELGLPEPHHFLRWEWHDLHALAALGKIFAPSAQALTAVWPGILPGLPPIHSYPCAADVPPVPGESAEAVRLRHAMADKVIAAGWAPSARVREALYEVARHRYAPEQDLKTAYHDNLCISTRRDEAGRSTSSVSAAWLHTDMVESLHLPEGGHAYEAGSGGCNAALLSYVVGPTGSVVTGDIDPYVVRRTQRFTAEAGSGQVTAFLGDAAFGAPARLVPRGGFDGSIITYSVWDIAPAWREQLADGRYLVLPLEMHGYTRAVSFQRDGDVLHARKFTHCGFVHAQGEHTRTAPVVDLLDGELQLRFEDGAPLPADGLEDALRGPRHEVGTGLVVSGEFYFGGLQLYAATTLPGFCRLAAHVDKGAGVTLIAKGSDAPAVLGERSIAYLIHVQTRRGDTPQDSRWEFFVHAFGEQGPQLAEQLVDTVRAWDQNVRANPDPALSVHPAGTPDHHLPPGDVLDRPLSRMVFQWPGRDGLLPAPVERAVHSGTDSEEQ